MKIPENMKDSTKEGLKKIIVDMITESDIKNIEVKRYCEEVKSKYPQIRQYKNTNNIDIVITINPTD